MVVRPAMQRSAPRPPELLLHNWRDELLRRHAVSDRPAAWQGPSEFLMLSAIVSLKKTLSF
jgi:hypothetical protein